ncbi:MAG: 3-isopropylmalate dehydratase large subunit [Deltaproteobacteria bacterium]|nr:3-isopropylmalate dehydratase large subunit [Deltaproteobacteria bacterium]
MAMTITEKILAEHAGEEQVVPGQIIKARVDLLLANDITGPMAFEALEKEGINRVFDPGRVVMVQDHYVPGKDISSSQQSLLLRKYSRMYEIVHYFDVGRAGIEHALLPQEGLVVPGDLVLGADSHTVTYGGIGAFSTGVGSTDLAAAMITGETWLRVPETIRFIYHGKRRRWVGGKDLILYTIGLIGVDGALYRSMEFSGPAASELRQADRFTMCNMAIEAGGKNGIFVPDDVTQRYVEKRSIRTPRYYTSDADARYGRVLEIDVGQIEPQVAFPPLPSNTRPAGEAGDVRIDQVVVGSCTNGWLEDLRTAAEVLKGHRVHPDVRMIIIPATPQIYRDAMREGLFEIFLDAGAVISPPTCGPCLGGYMGVLAEGERAVSTTNRNFIGRMGHIKSEVYLAGPAVAAASAVRGRIAPPDEM